MTINNFYITEENDFGKTFRSWADTKNISVELLDMKEEDNLHEKLEGIVLFHDNHDISKEDLDIVKTLDKNNIPTHKVDINGTLTATVMNFKMWIDRNNAKEILILGDSAVGKSENFMRFLDKIETA